MRLPERIAIGVVGIVGVWLCLTGPAGAAEVSPGYVLSEIATSALPTGGIDVVGGTIFVGVGPFGGGTQSVLRIDGSGETTLATGFNSISGLQYEPVQDRLIIGDNGLEVTGSTTGDTLYAVPSPFGAFPVPLTADQIELLTAGSLPSVAGIALDPSDPLGQRVFVSSASGPPGEISSIDLSTSFSSALYSVPAYASGLDANEEEVYFGASTGGASGGTVFAGPKDASSSAQALANGLEGAYDIVVASDGTILVTASRFFAASSVLRLDATTGDTLETVGFDFDFASALAEENGEIYVLEGGLFAQNRILVIPEPDFVSMLGLGLLTLVALRRGRSWNGTASSWQT